MEKGIHIVCHLVFATLIECVLSNAKHCADWKMPTEIPSLKKFHITEMALGVLVNIRSAYVMQLLVNIASRTSVNLKPIFDHLRGSHRVDLTRTLRTLDSCFLSQEHMCIGWTCALGQLLTSHTIDAAHVLQECKITPVTTAGIALLQGRTTASGVSASGSKASDSDNGDDSMFLTIHDLLLYGSDELEVQGTDQLLAFQTYLQSLLLSKAIDVEKPYRQKLVAVVAPPSEDGSTSKRRASQNTKIEFLLRINDDEEAGLLRSAKDTNIQLYRMPVDFKLVLFGRVGPLAAMIFGKRKRETIDDIYIYIYLYKYSIMIVVKHLV